MMHGREKSDPAVVAKKPTNKAGPTAAESAERRAGAEGNVGQQSTRRAQHRESVSQALNRVRQVARQRKKERFTALLHDISVDLLRLAFFELKRNAAPGVDGVTWQDYEADLEHKLLELHARVQRGAYRALPSRRWLSLLKTWSGPNSFANLGGLSRSLSGLVNWCQRTAAASQTRF